MVNRLIVSGLMLLMGNTLFASSSMDNLVNSVVGRYHEHAKKISVYNAHKENAKLVKESLEDVAYFDSSFKLDSIVRVSDKLSWEYKGKTTVIKMTQKNSLGYTICYESKDSVVSYYYDDQQLLQAKIFISCDSKGNYLKKVLYDSQGVMLSSYRFKYVFNVKGQVLKKEMFDGNGKLVETVVKKYNSDGIVIEQKSTDKSGTQELRYNDKGDLIEMKNANGSMSTYKYKYDEYGNWIECESYFSYKGEVYPSNYKIKEIQY